MDHGPLQCPAQRDEDRDHDPTEEELDWLTPDGPHDYDPTWDYVVAYSQRSHPLIACAQREARRIIDEAGVGVLPFTDVSIYPVHLEDDGATTCVAYYAVGTYSRPVILIDLGLHAAGVAAADLQTAVCDSVRHELRHAYQEAHDLDMCEDEAENGSDRVPF